MTLPTIYYIGSLPPKTGGELVNLQHVASLHQLGVRAVALVNAGPKVGEAVAMGNLPLEVLAPGRQFAADDIVVIPEFYGEAFAHFAGQPCRRVVHNQGPFLTFRGFDSIEQMNAAGLLAGLSCSSFCIDLMQRMGAAQAWHLVRPFVHPMFKRGAPKRLQVAHMPGKRPKEAPVVQGLLRHKYPQWAAVPWVPIAGVSRQACAAVLAESALFASFSCLEGLGLPPLEAMASGCLVAGFDGHGGRDFATVDNGLWVAEGDHEGFADALAASLAIAQAGDDAAQRRINAGLATAAQYSQARFEGELLAAWSGITGAVWREYQRDP